MKAIQIVQILLASYLCLCIMATTASAMAAIGSSEAVSYEVAMQEDFTDSGVGCTDDCLDVGK